jgi:pilus assembly protein CpaF
MGLLNRIKESPQIDESQNVPAPAERTVPRESIFPDSYLDLKERIHYQLIERIDLAKVESIPHEELNKQVREVVEGLLSAEADPTIGFNRDRIVEDILNEVFGLGPIQPFVDDPTISDILVNTFNQVYVERYGKLELTRTIFKDDIHLMHIIERIVSQVGRRVDESSPMVDARLPDGSRVNAIIPPLSLDGPILSIRKFGTKDLTVNELIDYGTLIPALAETLQGVVQARLNVLISGGTGSGKTTLLNVLSSFIPEDERIVTVEDAAELKLQQSHVVRLETRPANLEGQGAVPQRDLVRNALRMRPDRIIVGEVRGAEALDMLQAMNTGHDGSMTTLHANTPRDALRRLETMILMAGTNLPGMAMREQISSAINVMVHITRLSDGSRKIVKLSEITGMEGEIITMQDIFVFEKLGISEDGRVVGAIKATGIRPKFAEALHTSGIELPADIFDDGYLIGQELQS